MDERHFTAGVDEAGRGPLAGPVVAAAVIIDPARPLNGVDDSKKLTARRREELYALIVRDAACYALGMASVEEIDQLNIYHATLLAMRRAVEGLSMAPTRVLVDGNACPAVACPATAIVGGDATVPEISAASILAKVTRDRMMDALAREYPHYGFEHHRGYATAIHLAALQAHGASAVHRRSFRPVAEVATLFPGSARR